MKSTNRRQFLLTTGAAAAGLSTLPLFAADEKKQTQESIKAFCIDFNWDQGFAAPGKWADADPKEHIQWYKELGCNTVQTFCVSCNGYAWYKGGVVPEQPGLKHDFLTEMVSLGHKEKMKVFGYFCAGANTRWGKEHPDESYGVPASRHIPLTNRYLDDLAAVIEESLKRTGIDGFMVDWLFNPPKNHWLQCEQQMYVELMEEPFPGADQVTSEQTLACRRKALDRCWKRIYETARSVNPKALIWLTCYDLQHPEIAGSPMIRQADWLMNEAGDIETLKKTAAQAGKQTRLLTCLASWNRQDPMKTILDAAGSGLDIGFYGFAKPTQGSLLPPISSYLAKPVDSFAGDNKNIAMFARVFNNLPPDDVQK
ncbi:MAG: hypothetical protein LBQ54_12240 [Planctomycetaceae bacterium]|jgi:hypothetical protein|nr:hypothetical protein [Planctomycetaceae bacterium]